MTMETMKLDTRSKFAMGEREREASEVVIVRYSQRAEEPRTPCSEIKLAVSIESESNFYAGFTENLSECGVFVATRTPLQLGSAVEISISLPREATIRARGTVRWLRPYAESSELAPGMGVRFDKLSSKDSARIQAFSEARAPMFFDDESVAEPLLTR
jgi:uncharacterized protein (TIGR02266 family)